MATNPAFFRDLAYVFLAAFAGGLLAWRLRLPVIIGYILAGVLISPFTPGPSVSDVHTLELFAEIGVILLMFSIGLEFSVKELMRARWVALLGGPIGLVLSIVMGFGTGRLVSEFVRLTDLHLVVVEPDAAKVEAVDELADRDRSSKLMVPVS